MTGSVADNTGVRLRRALDLIARKSRRRSCEPSSSLTGIQGNENLEDIPFRVPVSYPAPGRCEYGASEQMLMHARR